MDSRHFPESVASSASPGTSKASASRGPRVVLGAPVFNHSQECRQAIESILAQTYADFRVVIIDDGSTDATGDTLRWYASFDPRVEYVRNKSRLGMIGNWRRAFQLCASRWPDAEYFAWVSDHDVWHPRWLACLVDALDRTPAAVLAYPLNTRIDTTGAETGKRSWTFETRGIGDRLERFRRALQHMSAGNMVYGLARVRDVRAAGVFRRVLVPDRLLVMELALRGEFIQVPQVLWFRRWYGNIFSLGRQRRSFFPKGQPLYALIPWWISHAAVIGWRYGVVGAGRPAVNRLQGLGLAARYLLLAGLLHLRQEFKQFKLDTRQQLQTVRASDRLQALKRSRWFITLQAHSGAELRGRLRKAAARLFRWFTRNFGLTEEAATRRRNLLAKMNKRLRDAIHNAMRRLMALVRRSLLAPLYLLVEGTFSLSWARRFAKRHIVPRVLTKLSLWDAPTEEALVTRKIVNKLSRSTRPVIIGPWLGDVSTEVLYWIPFLAWALRYRPMDPDRLLVISRGGVSDWYTGIASRYVDIFDFFPVAEYRKIREQASPREQKRISKAFDHQVKQMVQASLGLHEFDVLQPGLMAQLYGRYWQTQASVVSVEDFALHRKLTIPSQSELPTELPRSYIAARFHFNRSFPDTHANRQFVSRLLRALLEHSDVVLLNSGMQLDSNPDASFEDSSPRLHAVGHLMTPRTNLGLQTRIIAGARAFVGTYGGMSLVAASCGLDTLALFSDPSAIDMQHYQLALRAFTRMRPGMFTPVDTRSLDTLALAAKAPHPVELSR